ncbi:unnamed protein product [Bursaphelenchus xylophilus]|uniref:(pine wood nematode) hypothetical protein n=1 Tax=Bursaphelenchus xylophilus TaxID=6326 RepID=A0A1I7RKA9_BURXY|nr:unnamed protein product [Bursaphelenchus xylophilus]CAG9131397.1 unnamed protein product [Bursaphelenchus xylophilus]
MGVLMNITELPSDDLIAVYRTYEYVMFIATTLIVGYTLAIMLLTSLKSLSNYKWYLIHGIVWGYSFDSLGALIGAITLFPLPCYYGVNAAGSLRGSSQVLYFFIGFNCAMGKILAVFLQFEHRFQQALPLDSWYRKKLDFLHGKYEVHYRIALYIILGASINAPVFISLPNQVEQRQLLSDMDPVLAYIYQQHPTTSCFSSGTESWVVRITVLWLLVVVMTEVFLLSFIYSSIHRLKLSVNTYRLQVMLFWSLVAQMAGLFVFIMAPGLVYLGGATLGVRNMPTISVFCFAFFISHTGIDCLMVLFFIKPYRNVVLRNFGILHRSSRAWEPTSIAPNHGIKVVH